MTAWWFMPEPGMSCLVPSCSAKKKLKATAISYSAAKYTHSLKDIHKKHPYSSKHLLTYTLSKNY
jgi:predicted ribonuclease toxin of YeeF-YezG toxin-antitoxin module